MRIKTFTLACAFGVLSAWAAQALAASTQGDAQLIERGRYLAMVGDCAACHTEPGGKPFAGGLGIESPIGTIWSSNITPDAKTGIGGWSLDDFDRALRHGITKDGSTLYPAMPYVSYAKVKPSDVVALYAYFMHEVKPVAQPNRETGIQWPLSARWPLRFWRMMFAPAPVVVNAPPADGSVARGRYLVEGLGHCGACHTPRGIGLQERALKDADPLYLSGGVVDGYLAKSLRGDADDGLGAWSEADIVAFLKSGRNAHSAAFGGMKDVVQNSTQHFADADLAAIARYLKTLSPVRANSAAPVEDADDAAALKLRAGTDMRNGALTYVDNCAACHRTSGAGYGGTFPRLSRSSVVASTDPTSLITLVLTGGAMPSTKAAPTHFTMPGFAARLTDRDIADVLTFVRSSWGNRASAVSADQVGKLRLSLRATPQPARPENG